MTWHDAAPLVALTLESVREPVAARWAASGWWPVSVPHSKLPVRPDAALRALLTRCCLWGWGFGVVLLMVPAATWLDARAANIPLC